MICKILTQKDKVDWREFLQRIPIEDQDFYYSPEWYSLFEERGEGTSECFVFEEGDNIALYPYLINSINSLGYDLDGNYYDIQGAYGYNGVLATSYDDNFKKAFFCAFNEYCKKRNIISEFIRFNPVSLNHNFEIRVEPLYVLDNVLLDLSRSIDDIWSNSFDRGVRNATRKAQKEEMSFLCYRGSDIDMVVYNDFISIYRETMKRNNAADFYFFSDSFFSSLYNRLRDNLSINVIQKDSKIVSADLYLITKKICYGFISGTKTEYYQYSPNSLLRFESIKRFKELGLSYYSIGGGLAQNDSIYKYKKAFSKDQESKFYIGKIIHNEEIYNNVISQWELRSKNNENLKLLRYRDV